MNLLVFDGLFTPLEKKIDTKSKLIATLAGGPASSLLLVLGLSVLRSGLFAFRSEILADGGIAYFVNYAFFCNLFLLILSLAPSIISGEKSGGWRPTGSRSYTR